MGLPTSIPFGDDSADDFSEPLPDLDVPSARPPLAPAPQPPADRARDEFEEFQRWKRMKEAEEASQRTAATAPPAEPQRAPRAPKAKKPSIASVAQAPTRAAAEDQPRFPESTGTGSSTDGLTRKVDRKTGVSYYEIPKTRMGDDGRPELAMDLNIDDLNGEAKNFLGHLQIAPSAEEREAILRKKAEFAESQRVKKAELLQELDAKEGVLEEPEADPFAEKTKKRGLFGRKS